MNRLMNCFRNSLTLNSFAIALLAGSVLCFAALFTPTAWAQSSKISILNSGKNKNIAQRKVDLQAEAKLLRIYQLIGKGQNRQALAESELLLKAQPNFQLAQLVHGDLLSSFVRPVNGLGDLPKSTQLAVTATAASPTNSPTAAATLNELREESLQRLKALR
ncbi:MAG: hypothetical protein RJB10_1631, partial [Pseudomonadota bacterium]